MTHGPEHHLEEAEHAQHAAHNPFDRRVTLTVAIVAAMLACVSMLSHRAHNLTLQNQIKSNDNITERSNVFGYYQAKKNRQLLAEGLAAGFDITAAGDGTTPAKEKAKQSYEKWSSSARKWDADARQLQAKGHGLTKKIKEYEEEAHKYHHRANFYDFGELGVELAVVLCSISLLTKSRSFWFVGMASAALGFAVAMAAFVIPPGHAEHPEGEGEEVAWVQEEWSGAGRDGGTTAAPRLDERIDAHGDEHGAQRRHQQRTHAPDATDVSRHEQPAPRGQEAE